LLYRARAFVHRETVFLLNWFNVANHFDSLMASANGTLADAVQKMTSLVTDLTEGVA
jgi:hypothetical protein